MYPRKPTFEALSLAVLCIDAYKNISIIIIIYIYTECIYNMSDLYQMNLSINFPAMMSAHTCPYIVYLCFYFHIRRTGTRLHIVSIRLSENLYMYASLFQSDKKYIIKWSSLFFLLHLSYKYQMTLFARTFLQIRLSGMRRPFCMLCFKDPFGWTGIKSFYP